MSMPRTKYNTHRCIAVYVIATLTVVSLDECPMLLMLSCQVRFSLMKIQLISGVYANHNLIKCLLMPTSTPSWIHMCWHHKYLLLSYTGVEPVTYQGINSRVLYLFSYYDIMADIQIMSFNNAYSTAPKLPRCANDKS